MLRKLLISTLALLGLVCSAHAQSLPGPANNSNGWYVLMGEVMASGLKERLCSAAIVPVAEVSAAEATSSYKRGIHFEVSKKFGPYPSEQAAKAQLQKAGWQDKGREPGNFNLWLATAGCF